MVYLNSGCLVCRTSVLQGDISIGTGTIIHPFARIEAKNGSIVIGDNNIIEENVEIINDGAGDSIMIIGNGNTFQVGCKISCRKMGNNNLVESGCLLGRDVVLSFGCIVTAGG